MEQIRVGSRDSRLAVIQSRLVMSAIRLHDPALEPVLVTMKTTGDKILNQTLDKIGGKGLFVRELDAALLEGRVDITVHSGKDLPAELDPRLPLVAISRREDPRDVLVLPQGVKELTFDKPIGSSSARRTLQLKKLFPQARVTPVRGNIQTRLRKLDAGEFTALVLAAAGLKRLGLEERIGRYFSPEEMLPAAAQGILVVQAREDVDLSCLQGFHDPSAAACFRAERAFIKALDGGCSSPIAAYAVLEKGVLRLTGLDVAEDGHVSIASVEGKADEAELLGSGLGHTMREARTCAAK